MWSFFIKSFFHWTTFIFPDLVDEYQQYQDATADDDEDDEEEEYEQDGDY